MDFALATGLCFDGQFKALMSIVADYLKGDTDEEKYLKIREKVKAFPFPTCSRAYALLFDVLDGIDRLIRMHHRWNFIMGAVYLERMLSLLVGYAGTPTQFWILANSCHEVYLLCELPSRME